MSQPSPLNLLPLRLESIVVRGFGRGSRDLGIPTANLDATQCRARSMAPTTTTSETLSLQDLPTGIYWGYGQIKGWPVYTAAISIGYNPTYQNNEKTVEPHFIAAADDPRRHSSCCGETLLQDFYNQPIRLSVVEYLRPELPFEGLDKLVAAIKNDIAVTETKAAAAATCGTEDSIAQREKKWVASEEEV